jgi:hypothetical protein
MQISDILSAIAVLLSIVVFVKSNKDQEKNELVEQQRENIRKQYQILLKENQNRVSLIPYFHLEFEEKIYVNEDLDKKRLILPITLINLGKESATNIRLIPMFEDGGIENYFKTCGLSQNIHFVYSYLDKQYALSKDKIKFSSCCDFHGVAYDVYFKIRFDDLVGRTYEQKFRFQYCYTVMSDFSENSTTFLPVCIDDSDKTSNKL